MGTIGETWGAIRGIVRERFSFAEIKDVVGAAGLPIHRLAHLQQGSGGASKGQLADAIDALVTELNDAARDRFVVACVEEITRRRGDSNELGRVLGRAGWGITEGRPYPLALQLDLEITSLDERARETVATCLTRYRDGDFDGAITSICGLVDRLTESIYASERLGDHMEDAYQKRVSRSFAALSAGYQRALHQLAPNEVTQLWNNHKSAVSNAAYVLASLRREYSDAHGSVDDAPPELVQRALDCAVFIVRSIAAAMNGAASQTPQPT
jgi:hypothetical protein